MMTIKANIKNYIKDNKKIYLLLIFVIVIGVIKGNLDLISMKKVTIKELGEYINNFFNVVCDKNIKKNEIIFGEFFNSIKLFLLVWLCGSSIVGIPVIFYIMYIKGYVLGFCSGILIQSMGLNGVTLVTIGILPKEIFFIPIIVILGVSGIKFSISMIRNNKLRMLRQKNMLKEFGKYSLLGFFLCVVSFLVILTNWEISFKLLMK